MSSFTYKRKKITLKLLLEMEIWYNGDEKHLPLVYIEVYSSTPISPVQLPHNSCN